MAERRMFAKTIIDSDAFLDMPMSARLLYYDLAMRADDDGFINSPKKIMRCTGSMPDDLSILIVRKFIIPFENGVVVIKHWRIHNYIRKDTYNETTYRDEKDMLFLDENKAYKIKGDTPSTDEIRTVDEPLTQVRLGKVSLDKVSIEKESTKESAPYFDAENAWIETYKIYPKKSGEVMARVEWMKKIEPCTNRQAVAQLIFFATKMYLDDYKNKYSDDTNFKYLPRYEKWLQEDCDYWIREYEQRKRGDGD